GEAPRASLEPAPSSIVTVAPSIHMGGGVIFGLSTPRSGVFQARAELYGGGRLLVIAAHDNAANAQATGYLAGSWVVQPRAGVDLWMHPHASLNLWGGPDVVHGGDWSAGIALVIHSRSFDAR